MNVCKHGSFKTPHKHWEVQLMDLPLNCLGYNEINLELSQQNWQKVSAVIMLFGWFELSLYKTFEQDHAGWRFTFQVGPLSFMASTYDDRHWDDKNDCWMVYTD